MIKIWLLYAILFDGVSSLKKSIDYVQYCKCFLNNNYDSYVNSEVKLDLLIYNMHLSSLSSSIDGKTTCSALLLHSNLHKAFIVNVGDSRIYSFSNYFLEPLTVDDNLSGNSHILTKYIGLEELKLDDIAQKEIDIAFFVNEGYDVYQVNEIRLGIEHCVDINKYLLHEYNGDQMKQIRLGLEEKLDISFYDMIGFSSGQMEQIRLGLEEGLDVSVYADPFIDALEMEDIRHKLDGKDNGTSLNELQSQEVLLGLSSGVDVNIYADPAYDFKQMEQIRLGLEHGVDVMQYLNITMTSKEMQEKRLELEKAL